MTACSVMRVEAVDASLSTAWPRVWGPVSCLFEGVSTGEKTSVSKMTGPILSPTIVRSAFDMS